MIATSGVSLLYTAVVVPIQLFLWSYEDPCNIFPTLYLDLFVDLFFLVHPAARPPRHTPPTFSSAASSALECDFANSTAYSAASSSGHVSPIHMPDFRATVPHY